MNVARENMAAYVTCPACSAALEVDDQHLGWRVRCPRCQGVFVAAGTPAPVPVAVATPAPQQAASPFPSPPPATPPSAPVGPGTPLPATALAPSPPPRQVPVQQCGLATASLVLGIVSLACFGWLSAIPGIICGLKARKQIKESQGALGGENVAKVGLALCIIAVVLSVADDINPWNPLELFGSRKSPFSFHLSR